MTDETITRARAAVARLREVAETARTFGAIFTVEGPTALSLLALAEAVGRLAARPLDEGLESPWWAWGECLGCGAEQGPPNGTGYRHAADCPALAIDAALADLAALAPEEAIDDELADLIDASREHIRRGGRTYSLEETWAALDGGEVG